ncbi:MAG: 3-dehydroquinate synthase [Paracoccaceae bacterium]|nr:3-dehydroquinate synthase [Paracoccaceae bacterium]
MTNNYETLKVQLSHHNYKILIGSGLLDAITLHIGPMLNRKRVAVITDITISKLYLNRLSQAFKNEMIDCDTLILPCGEKSKSWETLSKTVEWLIKKKIERDDIIIAFGGGVIGDLVGFAASIVRRGVSVIQIPTTLLAQVDSSVGGKTGINSIHGKNLIGTFHQPALVIVDTDLLRTLPAREFLSGYAEVVKYGLLGDRKFFDWLDKNNDHLLNGDSEVVNYAVWKSCMAKAEIVIADEKEKGRRALLNLGHTFGHALESATNYSDTLIHGEGVSIGCILAFKFSRELGHCSRKNVERVIKHFKSVGLKTDFNDVPTDIPNAAEFVNLMMNDKKVKNGLLNLILVNDIGDSFVSQEVPLQKLKDFLTREMG